MSIFVTERPGSFIPGKSFVLAVKMDPGHVIDILTATLDPAHQEAAGKKLDEVIVL